MNGVTQDFLPLSDFDGDDSHRPVPYVKLGGGSAVYNGQIVFSNMLRADVAALLPPWVDVKLATNHGAHPDVHPVFHLHGEQTNTAWVIDGRRLPVGSNYWEFMLLIPFVQVGASPQWFNFVVRMYLNDWGAVLLGKDFGYRKVWGLFDVVANTFDVKLPDFFNPFAEQAAFHSHYEANPGARAAELQNWPMMETIASMPILGVDEVTGAKLGSYFRLDFSAATLSPVDCTHDYKPAFDPAMGAGIMTSVEDGAVDVTGVVWQIDFPAIFL
jgi:hypothetical protein